MIKVCWEIFNSRDWIGGINYFSNLAAALKAVPDCSIEPMLLIHDDENVLPDSLKELDTIPYPIRINPHNKYSLPWIFNKAVSVLFKQHLSGKILHDRGVRLFSHVVTAGFNNAPPSLCWIADFQHKHFPELYTKIRLLRMEQAYRQLLKKTQGIILSSKAAQKDFHKFYPDIKIPSYVLPFVATIPAEGLYRDKNELLEQYRIDRPYFFLPNQLWVHKNHKVVIEALKIAKTRNPSILVVCTGNKRDWRNLGYCDTLLAGIKEYGLENNIFFLGMIPLPDVHSLLRYSIANINPSLFEGWSTTVEESKSMGKDIILSNIDVHKEQAPERGTFFDPRDAEGLAEVMLEKMDNYDLDYDENCIQAALADMNNRLIDYGRKYEKIVYDALALSKNKHNSQKDKGRDK